MHERYVKECLRMRVPCAGLRHSQPAPLDILSNPHLRVEYGFWNVGFFPFREHSS
jgi:hypothetical protein